MRKPRPYSQLKGGIGKSPLTMKKVKGVGEDEKSSPLKVIPWLAYGALTALTGLSAGVSYYNLTDRETRQRHASWLNNKRSRLIYDDYTEHGSFGKAFAAANDELGPGKVFMWNGNAYKTTKTTEYPNPYAKEFFEEVVHEHPAFKDNPVAVENLKKLWIDAGMPRIEKTSRWTDEDRAKTDFRESMISHTGDSSGIIYAPGDGAKAASDVIAELTHMKSSLERDDGFVRDSKGRFTRGEEFIENVVGGIAENVTIGGVGRSIGNWFLTEENEYKNTASDQFTAGYEKGYDDPHGEFEERTHFFGFAKKDGEYIVGNDTFVGWDEDSRDDSGNPALWEWNEDKNSTDFGKRVKQKWFYGAGNYKGTRMGNNENLRKAYFSQVEFEKDYHELSFQEKSLVDAIVGDKVNHPDGFDLHNGEVTFRDLNLNINQDIDEVRWNITSMPYQVGDANTDDAGKIGGNDYYTLAAIGLDPLSNKISFYDQNDNRLYDYENNEELSVNKYEADFIRTNGHEPGMALNYMAAGSQERADYYKARKWNPDLTSPEPEFLEDGSPNPKYVEKTAAQQAYNKNETSYDNPLDNFELYESGSTLRAETYNNPGVSGLDTRRGLFNSTLQRREMTYDATTKKNVKTGKLLDISIHPKDYKLFSDVGTYANNWGDGSEKDVLTSEKYEGVKHLILNDKIYDGQTNKKVEWGEGQKEEYLQALNDYWDSLQ